MRKADEKILRGFERISIIIRSLLWDRAKQFGLSPNQIQFMRYIFSHPDKDIDGSYLAKEFNLSLATVSDAIKVLEAKQYMKRLNSINDKRRYYFKFTEKGMKITTELMSWENIFFKQLRKFSINEKERLVFLLMKLIKCFQESGIIQEVRICLSCENFKRDAKPGTLKPNFCSLTRTYLSDLDLNFDCSEYKKACLSFK